jgi:hypothetical protein
MSVRRFFVLPLHDTARGLERCLGGGLSALGLALTGLALGWWVYVPVHELLHAFGCWASGGTVSRLEIDALYGGGLLARALPFVVADSAYAGRLSGFDTGGSDLVYLATDLAPFGLTLLPGVWALRAAAGAARPLAFGLALPFALAPFLSLPGDAYEIGSILVTRVPPWNGPETTHLLRGDDLMLKAGEVAGAGGVAWLGLGLAAAIGLGWAFLTYGAGGALARLLGKGPVEPATALAERAAGGA